MENEVLNLSLVLTKAKVYTIATRFTVQKLNKNNECMAKSRKVKCLWKNNWAENLG